MFFKKNPKKKSKIDTEKSMRSSFEEMNHSECEELYGPLET